MNSIRLAAKLFTCMLMAFAVATPSFASTVVTLPLNSGGTGASTGRVFTVTVGSMTVKVRVTAWSTSGVMNSSNVTKGGVHVYSNGLGVTSSGEGSSSPQHAVDNAGNKDFLIFQFDQPVELESAKFTTYNAGSTRTDGDATIAYGSTTGNWMVDPLAANSNYGQLAALFGNSFAASNVNSTSGQTATTRLLNAGNNSGNLWLIGSSFNNPNENCRRDRSTVCFDGFKLSQLSVQSAVPEPSTWMMMLIGFGFVGFSMRRRSRNHATGLATA